ncbi:undecaprenyl-phosphate glucose phosphotransferase [Methylotenera versatilis]|uniref:Undecaprenyl-phosphate glucose phosphotransferase n=1 Tax=Methylotenera versatilis (strain 301) TaxID=666681 RepID=D7DLU9_METV0|nr:undecaprenyl-phosphate glucose phosphotransferase [Methylotenera versatilis]ADI30643.1 Undecaprenyl-phosphate glucose phosphotransferase [Methylotenera versatilis 301]
MSNKNQLPLVRKASGIRLARDNILSITESLTDPLVAVIGLWAVAFIQEGQLSPIYLFLSLIIFFLSYPGESKLSLPINKAVMNIVFTWIMLSSLLILFAYTTRYMYLFSTQTIVLWVVLTPIMQILALLLLRSIAPLIMTLQGPVKQAVVAGINEQSIELALRLNDTKLQSTNIIGFFEDRTLKRVAENTDIDVLLNGNIGVSILGKIDELADYIKTHQVNVIYLSLPMSGHPRILKLLDDLKDTTASIYFIPDIFMTDLIQGRMGQIDDIPVVAVCETPFTGFNGVIKRTADIAFSLAILILILPILIIIAIGVKLSSPGPVIFKQRRYGLDGKEILVYKFRSMSVCEDGGAVTQATKNDQRVTKLGAFLRKSSLDELPQFINVLQGRMSVVGPRPHAVSHNEMYRKLIKGYMIRHKVKPGITGWAQVNGLRGETETLDKMKARIDFDLEYLRNWSPKLDIYIVFRTVSVVFKGEKNAY